VISAFAERLRETLGECLVGMYLGGSFSMGDFVEGVSDYDVLVLVADPLQAADLTALATMHEQLLRDHRDAERLEGDYVAREWLTPEGTREAVPWFRRGRLQEQPAFMLSADNIANFRSDGIVVLGSRAADVLPAVHPDQVRAAVRVMLGNTKVCATEGKAADEILALLRSMRALETGAPTTKTDGLRWGFAHLDVSWHPVLHRADAVRQGTTVGADDDTLRRGIDALRTLLLPSVEVHGAPPHPRA